MTDPAIVATDLCVVAGQTRLLDRASLSIRRGEIVLLVGGSGAGKSVFLKLLAGLAGPWTPGLRVSGSIQVLDRELVRKKPDPKAPRHTGIVFQDFALFDELSVGENIEFARAHRPSGDREADPGSTGRLMAQLGIQPSWRVGSCSGGQKQRAAIARTLAFDPEILIYDEPTSGLDPANALAVAELIRKTNESFGKTSVVVTHDYANLLLAADRVVFFDSDRGKLVDVSPADLPSRMSRRANPPLLPDASAGLGTRFARRFLGILESSGRLPEAGLSLLRRIVPTWRSLRWGLRYLWHYLKVVSGPTAMLYLALSGGIVGFVGTYFTFKFFPYRAYTEPLILDDILASLGYALFRVMVPVLASILIAARSGAAVAADVGNRVYGRQVDAMRSFGAEPEAYLFTNIVHAYLWGVPFLTWIGFASARLASMLVFAFIHPDYSLFFWQINFHALLRDPAGVFYWKSGWVLAKMIACGAGIATISYSLGMAPKPSGQDVSRCVTNTIIVATIYVLLVHFAFAFFEFAKG